MNRIIEIDIFSKTDLFEKYNSKKISKELINYLIETTSDFNMNDTIKIVINNHLKEKISCETLIKEELKNEYNKDLKRNLDINIIQLVYLIIGVIFIFVSTLIKIEVFREVILIGGWVLIWAVIELELSSSTIDRKRRKVLKKLLRSEILENYN